MSKTIKNVADLPSWFKLSNYVGAESLDATGWYEQLSFRKELYFFQERSESSVEIRQMVTDASLKIYKSPIIDFASDDHLSVFFSDGALEELKSSKLRYSAGVRFMTVRDLYHTEILGCDSWDRNDFRKFFSHYLEEKNWRASPDVHPHSIELVDEPVNKNYTSSGVYLCVNPDLPDHLLVKQFQQMLQSIRNPNNDIFRPVRDHNRPAFSSWIAFGVLPYLDLQLWARENKVKIPNRVMADAIFPAGEGGEEVVRKTTEKMAIDLLSDGHLKKLASIAAYEKAEKNNG